MLKLGLVETRTTTVGFAYPTTVHTGTQDDSGVQLLVAGFIRHFSFPFKPLLLAPMNLARAIAGSALTKYIARPFFHQLVSLSGYPRPGHQSKF